MVGVLGAMYYIHTPLSVSLQPRRGMECVFSIFGGEDSTDTQLNAPATAAMRRPFFVSKAFMYFAGITMASPELYSNAWLLRYAGWL